MPKDKNNGREMTPDEKFRSFFSTTAVDIPEEMTRRDENQPEEKPQKRFGLFGRGKEKQETDEAAAEQPQEMPTGEVRLGEDAQPEPEADLELMLKPEADPEQELAPWPFLEKEAEDAQPEAPAKKPEEKSAPQTAEPPAAVKPETPRQSAVPAARPAEQHSTAKSLRHPKNAPEVLLPQEEQEQQEMAQLKAMINGLSDQKPEKPAPRAEAAPAAETEPAESKKKPSGAPLPAAVFAAVKETAPELQPEPVPQPEKQPVADFFGKAQSEDAPQAPLAPAEEPAAKEDTMSLPLLPLDGEEPQQAPEKAPAAPQPELKAEAEDAVSPEEHAETELTEPEATADKLHRMSAELTLRCVLGGILAVVLLHFGLVSDGLLPAMAALDPDAAPAAFYGANLLLDFAFVNETVTAWGIAVVHSIFNLTATAVLLPFANGLEKLAILTIPDDAEKESFALLDERLLNTPAMAVARARSATADMAELARVGVMQAMSLTHTWDDTLAQKVRDEESKVDQYEDALGTYLVKLSSRELNHADSQSVNTLLHTISDFERISDHSVNLLESAQEMHTKEINFSTDAREELQVLEDAVQDVLNRTTDAFRKDDLHLASKVEPLETVVDELVRAIKARHVARLQAGSCSIEYGFVLEDLLTNYERVCDHCSNVAVAQIEVAQDSFDTHAYLNDLRSGHASTKESEQFQRRLNRYRERYLFPDENVTETEDKQA